MAYWDIGLIVSIYHWMLSLKSKRAIATAIPIQVWMDLSMLSQKSFSFQSVFTIYNTFWPLILQRMMFWTDVITPGLEKFMVYMCLSGQRVGYRVVYLAISSQLLPFSQSYDRSRVQPLPSSEGQAPDSFRTNRVKLLKGLPKPTQKFMVRQVIPSRFSEYLLPEKFEESSKVLSCGSVIMNSLEGILLVFYTEKEERVSRTSMVFRIDAKLQMGLRCSKVYSGFFPIPPPEYKHFALMIRCQCVMIPLLSVSSSFCRLSTGTIFFSSIFLLPFPSLFSFSIFIEESQGNPSIFYQLQPALQSNLNCDHLTELMERMAAKSLVTGQQEEHSFRSNRTASHYNINDYLPPSLGGFSRTSVFASRQKEKIYTEPNDRVNSLELLEMKRKLERQEEERESFRREIERLNDRLQAKDREIKEKDEIILDLKKKLDDSEGSLKALMLKCKQKPALAYSRSNLHFIYFPKFSQRYEVSVQTDAVEYHIPSPNFPKAPLPIKADRELSQIEEKLSKLNQFKKFSRERAAKIQQIPVRYQKIDPIFSKIDDKQNMMRLSNTFERLSNIPEERIRQQTIQILPVDIDQMERLIRFYMD